MKEVANTFLEENKYVHILFMLLGALIIASFENFISQVRNPGSGNNWVSL